MAFNTHFTVNFISSGTDIKCKAPGFAGALQV